MATQSVATVTPANEVLGPGALWYDLGGAGEVQLGASKGGGSFTNGVEWRETEADQDKGPTKGHRNKTRIAPMLTLNMLEIGDVTKFPKFFHGITVTDETTYDSMTETYAVAGDDYLSNIAWVGEGKDGNDMIIILENVLSDGAFEAAIAKDEEIVPTVQFTAHWDPEATDKNKAPYEIRKMK